MCEIYYSFKCGHHSKMFNKIHQDPKNQIQFAENVQHFSSHIHRKNTSKPVASAYKFYTRMNARKRFYDQSVPALLPVNVK